MKNFTLLLLLITAVSFSSCKKNPDEKAAANIVGKWYLHSFSEKDFKNGVIVNEQNSTKVNSSEFVELKSNGTGVDSDNDQFTYKISGSKLTVKYGDNEEETQEIVKLTSSELVLASEENWENGSDKHKYVWEGTYKKK